MYVHNYIVYMRIGEKIVVKYSYEISDKDVHTA